MTYCPVAWHKPTSTRSNYIDYVHSMLAQRLHRWFNVGPALAQLILLGWLWRCMTITPGSFDMETGGLWLDGDAIRRRQCLWPSASSFSKFLARVGGGGHAYLWEIRWNRRGGLSSNQEPQLRGQADTLKYYLSLQPHHLPHSKAWLLEVADQSKACCIGKMTTMHIVINELVLW